MILIITYTVLIVLGLKIVTSDGMLFGEFRQKIEEKNSKYLDPLILCEWCMPTVYTSIGYGFYFINNTLDFKIFLYYPLCIAAASFVSGTLWLIHKILLNLNDNFYLKNQSILKSLQDGKSE